MTVTLSEDLATLPPGSEARRAFMATHAEAIYEQLTDGYTNLLRVSELAYAAAEALPGLVPTQEQIAGEREHKQGDKVGLELDQGIFVSEILACERPAYHLLHAMAQPTGRALELLPQFQREDRVDLGTCILEHRGGIGYLTINHQRYLNAEDDQSTYAMEVATDLVLLDDRIETGVLRGAHSEHPKYAGRRVFDSGVNLTRLYFGEVSLIEFFIERELGLLTKWYRGHSAGDGRVTIVEQRHEKPWVAGVETFAIGGGCQYLLVMDRVVARSGAYMNLPARKEGFIPGCGNLRLPRFVGERATRQGIFFNRHIWVDEPDARHLVDELVGSEEEMDEALERSARLATGAGATGVNANRTQMRVGVESLEVFRHYMANLAIGQARCMYSPSIIRNLEQMWDAAIRRHEA